MSSSRVVQEEKESNDDDDDDDDDDEILEKINLMVSKLPVPRKRNALTRTASKSQEKCTSSPNERTRTRTSKIEARKTYHSSGIDGCPAEPSKDQEPRRKSENSKLNIELENSKLERTKAEEEEEEDDEIEEEEEEMEDELEVDLEIEEEEEKNSRKEENAGSETEEEARQLVKDETETGRLAKKLTKSWSRWKRDENKSPRVVEKFNENDRNSHRSNFRKTARISRETRNDGRERMKISHDWSTILSNVASVNCCETRDETRLDDELVTRGSKPDFRKNRTCERDLASEERTRGRMYERANSVLDFSRKKYIGASSLRRVDNDDNDEEDRVLVASETRTRIDEMIDGGLNHETTREKSDALLQPRKDLPEERVSSLRRGSNVDESRKIITPQCFCETRTRRRELSPLGDRKIIANGRTRRENCLCDEFAKMFADDTSLRREYVRKLKNRRWAYLDNMQNDLEKLYGLERLLDTCSPERNATSSTVARENFVPATLRNEAKKSEEKTRNRFVMES